MDTGAGENLSRDVRWLWDIVPGSHRRGSDAPIPSMQRGSPGGVKVKLLATHTPTYYTAELVFESRSAFFFFS